MSPGRADLGSNVACQASHFISACFSFPFRKSEIMPSALKVVVNSKEINTEKSANRGPIAPRGSVPTDLSSVDRKVLLESYPGAEGDRPGTQ